MFPIRADTLPLRQIARYWSRVITPTATRLELLNCMAVAWWRGEFVGDAPWSRLKLLQSLFRSQYQGIVFFVGDEPDLPEPTYLPDGAVAPDVRPRIKVPCNDVEAWNDTNCAPVYEMLATTSLLTDENALGPVFGAIKLSRREFGQWLTRHGWDHPSFWRPLDADAVGSTDQIPAHGTPRTARQGGRRPVKFRTVAQAMRDDILANRLGPGDLADMLQKKMVERYGILFPNGVSRDVVTRARRQVLSEINSRPKATNDN